MEVVKTIINEEKKITECPNCKRLLVRIKSLAKKIVYLEKENQSLKKKLYKYENPNTPPSQSINKKTSNKKTSLAHHSKPGQKKGHPGTTRKLPNPTKIVEVRLDKCPHCNKSLSDPFKIEKRIIEEIPEPQPVEIIEYRQYHYVCNNCKKYIIAEHPQCPKQGRFGKRLLAKVVQLKYEQRLPHRKIVALLKKDFGIKITPAAIFEMTNRVACALKREYEKIIRKMRKRRVVNIDETGMKVDGKNHWIWTFVSAKEKIFAIRKSRGVEVLKSILGKGFKGIIGCDGLRVYLNFTKNLQRCWAHIIREARFISNQAQEGEYLLKMLNKLYEDVVFYCEIPPPKNMRVNIYHNLKKRLRYCLNRSWKEGMVKKFINKLKAAEDYLFTCILHPAVEPTNNRAERALREQVILRKIIGTLRNGKGIRIHEVITSIFATWKQLGLNIDEQLLAYL